MRRPVLFIIASVAIVLFAAAGGRAAWRFLAQDRCLDNGGARDAAAESCIERNSN
jgi:hypothetical protein